MVKRPLAFLVLVMALVAGAVHAATLSERAEAVLSLCVALRAADRLPAEAEGLAEEIQTARAAGDVEALGILLAEAEELLATVEPAPEAVALTVAADGRYLAGAAETRVMTPHLWESGVEFIELDPAGYDDLALHALFAGPAPFVCVAPVNRSRPEPAERGLVPPRGWAEHAALADRWRRLAELAGRKLLVARPGLDLERSDLGEWLLAESRHRRAVPLYVHGFRLERLLRWLEHGDTWIVRPDFAPGERPSPATIFSWLSRLPAATLIMVLPPAFPWLRELKEALKDLPAPVRTLSFRDGIVTAFHAGNRYIFINRSGSSAHIRLAMVEREGEAARSLNASVAVLHDDGRTVDSLKMEGRNPAILMLPGDTLTFIEIESDAPNR